MVVWFLMFRTFNAIEFKITAICLHLQILIIMADIDQLRKYCLSLPAVTEDVKWENDLVFSIGNKMFCVAGLKQPLQFSFKVPGEDFEEMVFNEGFKPAPYLARAKWVLATDPSKLHREEWERLIKQSYELVKNKLPKKTRLELKIKWRISKIQHWLNKKAKINSV